VDALVLVSILAASVALAVMGARAMLVAVLHLMAHPPAPMRLRWGGAAVGLAIFWLWYMAPSLAARAPAGVTQALPAGSL
jgi:hypothetical protein